MTAPRDILWNRLNLYNKDSGTIMWSMEGPFTSDTIVGLVLAGTMLTKEINPRSPFILIGEMEKFKDPVFLDTIINQQYMIHSSIEEYKINLHLFHTYRYARPSPGKIGIWVLSFRLIEPYTNYWDFIEVEHADEFMQGFITMCEAFKADFDNYLFRLPFDSNGVEYDIPAYNLKGKFP